MTFKSERKVVLRVKEVSHSLTLEAGFGTQLFLPKDWIQTMIFPNHYLKSLFQISIFSTIDQGIKAWSTQVVTGNYKMM